MEKSPCTFQLEEERRCSSVWEVHKPDLLLAAYGAVKSFVLWFGEALHVELAPKPTLSLKGGIGET